MYQLAPYIAMNTYGASSIIAGRTVLVCPSSENPSYPISDYKAGRLEYTRGRYGTIGYLRHLLATPTYGLRYGRITYPTDGAIWVLDGANDGSHKTTIFNCNNASAIIGWISPRHAGRTNIVWLDWHVSPKVTDDIEFMNFRVHD